MLTAVGSAIIMMVPRDNTVFYCTIETLRFYRRMLSGDITVRCFAITMFLCVITVLHWDFKVLHCEITVLCVTQQCFIMISQCSVVTS